MFKDDLEAKNKFKILLPPGSDLKDNMIYDYFEQNSKKQMIVKKQQFDPTAKGFDIR